jgi:anti-anti-sigma regulatory factor
MAPDPESGVPPAAYLADAARILYVTPLGEGGGLRLAGEVDISSIGQLEQALEDVTPAAAREEITLDMGGLSFLNVAGARAVVRAAERWTDGRRVVLRHPPRALPLVLMFFPDSRARIEVIPR